MKTPKYKLGQYVICNGQRKLVNVVGHALHNDEPVYKLMCDAGIYSESDLTQSHKYMSGDRVWFKYNHRYYSSIITSHELLPVGYVYYIKHHSIPTHEDLLYPTEQALIDSIEIIHLCKS